MTFQFSHPLTERFLRCRNEFLQRVPKAIVHEVLFHLQAKRHLSRASSCTICSFKSAFDIRCADRRIFSAMACQLMSFIQGVTFRESLVHYFVPWFIFFGFTFCVVHNISFHFGIIIGKKWEMRWLLWPIILAFP